MREVNKWQSGCATLKLMEVELSFAIDVGSRQLPAAGAASPPAAFSLSYKSVQTFLKRGSEMS
jgi:hypothetical protein